MGLHGNFRRCLAEGTAVPSVPWEEVSVWQALGQGDEPISLGRSLDFREDAWKVHGVLLALRRHWASGSWYFKNPREAGVAFMEILLCAKDLAHVAA